MDEWKNKMGYTHARKYYSALKRKRILRYAATYMSLEEITLNEINQSKKTYTV